VLTLWACVVAERLGYQEDEALSLAKAVSGLNAQSKGRRLGIYQEHPEEEQPEKQRKPPAEETLSVELLGRPVPAVHTKDGLRAVEKDNPIQPQAVQRYLEGKFGEAYPEVRQAMRDLAGSFTPTELRKNAYGLYEKFRPEIPEGTRGWGAQGDLDLSLVSKLRKSK
jgi:hypothetical protein